MVPETGELTFLSEKSSGMKECKVQIPARGPAAWLRFRLSLFALTCTLAGCSNGFEPPAEPPVGAIRALVTYQDAPASWESEVARSTNDLRFVAMRFTPQDTTDFFQLNRMAISDGLDRNVVADTVLIGEVEPGVFLYNGIAQQFSPALLDWRPLGLTDGIFEVSAGETTTVRVVVDFDNLPPFPPS